MDSNGFIRHCRSPIRSTMGRLHSWPDPWMKRPNDLGDDAKAYRQLMSPLVAGATNIFRELVGPFRFPRHAILAARFGWRGFRSARNLAESYFRGERARALLAGLAGHAQLPLEKLPSAAIALMLGLAGHAVGWPIPRGGSQRISDALAAILRQAGGEIETDRQVDSLDELPPSRAVLLDVTPRQVLAIAGERLPPRYRRRLERYRYGMGVFKIDWALNGPIPVDSRSMPTGGDRSPRRHVGRNCRRANRKRGTASHRKSRSCCLLNRLFSIRRVRRPASTSPGAIAMCLMLRRLT